MPLRFLTDEDAEILKEVIRLGKESRINSPSKLQIEDDHQAPEVYIALIPAGGIAARSGTTISSALCTIYRNISGTLTPVTEFDHLVYSIQDSALSGGSYTAVKRDKYGEWYADAGGGGVVLKHAVIRSVCDIACGTYVVEILERSFTEDCTTATETGTGTAAAGTGTA
jgi:hypothetical protein|tara:strand:- start:6793 stop:7299 length:507 start_codon:yes stop_codon:yes gene_type:complete